MKSKYLFFVLIFFVPLLKASAGNIDITEIMYDLDGADTGREWVEVYNNSGSSINLTKYKFVESGTAHAINHLEGSADLPNGQYAIIADNPTNFLIDNPNVSKAQIYDSSFSLSNDKGESLSLKDESGNTVYEVTYDVSIGANDDGKSLQFVSSWVSAIPTPMISNLGSSNTNENTNNNNNNNTSSTSSTTTTNEDVKTGGGLGYIPYQKDPEMMFSFSYPKIAIVGTLVEFQAILYGYSGDRVTSGRFIWNFGDGATQEDQYLRPVSHVYYYPGEHTVSLIYKNGWYEKIIAIGKFNISVTDTPIILKDYYDKPIPAVKIANTKDEEYNIGGYIIRTGDKDWKIPEGTFIGGKDELILNLPLADYNKDEIKLLHPTGYIASEFSHADTSQQSIKTNNVFYSTPNSVKSNVNLLDNNETIKSINLSASAANAVPKNKIIPYIGLIVIILISSGLIFYFKNKNNNINNQTDYSLQDE